MTNTSLPAGADVMVLEDSSSSDDGKPGVGALL